MNISKLCADYLRAISHNYGVKLKSGHAHELVAAFFGYKSKAAMLADNLFPIDNLKQANILVLALSSIDERRKLLEDLSFELPDTNLLAEEMLAYLKSREQFSGRAFKTWQQLAEVFTNEYLQKNGNLILPGGPYKNINIFNTPVYEFNPKLEFTDQKVKLYITNTYRSSNSRHSQQIDITLSIDLFRIMGHIGYSRAEISFIDSSSHVNQATGMGSKL